MSGDGQASGANRATAGGGGFALGLGAALLFALATPASKQLLTELGPLQLAGLLYLGAALGVLPVALGEGRAGSPRRMDAANRARLGGAVLFGGVVGPVLLLVGLNLSSAASVSLLLNLELVLTALLGALFFREHLGRLGAGGVAAALVAGVLLGVSGGWPGLGAAGLVALACLCWAIDNHFTARIDGISPAKSTLCKGVVAGTTNLVLGVALGAWKAGVVSVVVALAVGALAYGASIAMYIASAQRLGATRAQVLFACSPFAAALLSLVFLREMVGVEYAFAAPLLVLSVVLLFRSRHEHAHVHEALAHVHAHRHDDGHHDHTHDGPEPGGEHSHWHEHDAREHAHPHWPDLHHRHEH